MKAIASSFLVFAAAFFWHSSVQFSEYSSIRYFGILLSLIVLWFGLAGFWRSWSSEEREKQPRSASRGQAFHRRDDSLRHRRLAHPGQGLRATAGEEQRHRIFL